MTGNFTIDLAIKRYYERKTNATSHILKAIHGLGSGPLGLTPDAVKLSDEYRQAKRDFDAAFQAERKFNRDFLKLHKKQYAAQFAPNMRGKNEAQ